MIISEKLIGEVLGLSFIVFRVEDINKDIITLKIMNNLGEEEERLVSTHAFLFRCKNWAWSKGYVIKSWWCKIGIAEIYSVEEQEYLAKGNEFSAETEEGALLEAFEWILNNDY